MDEQPTPETTVTSGKWAVGLVGGLWELAEIAPHFTGDIRVRHDADEWELTATRFDEAYDANVIRTLAGEMLALINGVARLRLDRPDPITLGNVRRYHEDGGWDAFVFPEPARLRLRGGTPTIMVNGVTVSPRSWEPDIELAVRDIRVQAVLAFLATEPTWRSLYAALDTVLKDPRTGRRDGLDGAIIHVRVQLQITRDPEEPFVLTEPKTQQSRRDILLAPSAIEALRVQRLRQAAERLAAGSGWKNVSDLIFTTAEGEPLHPNTIRWVLAQGITTAGVPVFPFHSLRRFAATVVGGSGDMAAAQALLGHRAETLTADVYVSKTAAAMHRAAEVMEAAMGR